MKQQTSRINIKQSIFNWGRMLEQIQLYKQRKQRNSFLTSWGFFYFAKTAFERIQLALTFNDVIEAKLLAGFASERLAEEQALFASGNQETAIKTINQAL